MDEQIFEDIRASADIDGKTLTELALKTTEEVGELAEAVLSFTTAPGCAYKEKTEQDILEEGVDVMICVLATIFRSDPFVEFDDVRDVFDRKIGKWAQKIKENPRGPA